MIYADTDFILALAKKNDWLKKKADMIYEKYKGQIFISSVTLIELMLIAKKIDYDPSKLLAYALNIAELKDDNSNDYFLACEYQKEYGLGVLDSLHIVKSKNNIISSDKKFKEIPFLNVVDLSE